MDTSGLAAWCYCALSLKFRAWVEEFAAENTGGYSAKLLLANPRLVCLGHRLCELNPDVRPVNPDLHFNTCMHA